VIPVPWLLAGALALMLGAGLAGYRAGGQITDARWQRQAAEIRAAADKERQRMLDTAAQLAEDYELDRARLSAQINRQRGQLREALNAPILECPATVGDVVVPRGAVARLRDAASGADPSRPATGGAGAPVQPRP
jgi:hypothetical protein